MYMSLKVIEALNILRNAAENDFERHRLDILINDLTAPPTVEIINENQQAFNGSIYYKNKNHLHYDKCTNIHREVFRYYNGKIPEGYDIHHIDNNPNNNDISNLQMLTRLEHRAIHSKPSVRKICPYCGKEFTLKHPSEKKKFCSTKCSSQSQKIIVERICPTCGKKFVLDKPCRKNIYCSRSCASKARFKSKSTLETPKTD